MRLVIGGFWIGTMMLALIHGAQASESTNPRETLKQYMAELQRNPNDQALREKIIKLVQTMEPKPAVPDEVDELLGRALNRFKNAKSETDYADAAEAFKKVLLVAPWVGDYYFNLGQALEKAGKYDEAITNYRFYLMAKAEAEDAKQVRVHIGELKDAEETAINKKKEENASVERLNGKWKTSRVGKCATYFDLLLIEVKGTHVEIHTKGFGDANSTCPGTHRDEIFTTSLNLLVFSGMIQRNQLEGSLYCFDSNASGMKSFRDYVTSDFIVTKTIPFKFGITWITDENSFATSERLTGSYPYGFCPDTPSMYYTKTQEWSRGW